MKGPRSRLALQGPPDGISSAPRIGQRAYLPKSVGAAEGFPAGTNRASADARDDLLRDAQVQMQVIPERKGAGVNRWSFLAAAALIAALVVANVAAGRSTTVTAAPTVVKVSMYEMGFKLSKRIVHPGVVVFRVVNDGAVEHDFRIRGKGTPMLGAGERATLTVRFPKPGRFTFVCTVPGHAAAGMVGKLIVKRP